MKKFVLIILSMFVLLSAKAVTLEAAVSVNDVPEALFGSWRISGKLDTTNSPTTFKPQSIDFWNLSRIGDTLTLNNPFNGATADVSVKTVEGDVVVFTRKTNYDNNKTLTDSVTLRLGENEFSGINELKLETFSLIDNHLMKTETATYLIKGEKISGESVLKK